METLRLRSGITKPFHGGTVGSLLELQKKDGVDYSVVLNIATNAHQQKSVNDFAASIHNGKDIFAFGFYDNIETTFIVSL